MAENNNAKISASDFEIFKEALTEENLELQVLIIQKLEQLAKALGETATRTELLPFIQTHYLELHDEILFHLAERLQTFLPLTGGLEHAKIVFDLLGKLSITDENVVRERAVKTLISISADFTEEQIERYLLPIIYGLIEDDWFTSKCSAVMLFVSVYPKLSVDKKSELRNTFKNLIQDDSPMVRKAAASACVDFVAVVEDVYLKSEFVPIFRDIAQDPMDSVRCGTVEIALALTKRLGQEGLDDSIFQTIELSSDDASWRLRQTLANAIAKLQSEIPFSKYRGKILALYQKLAQDPEAEIRILTANNLFDYCKNLKASYDMESRNNCNNNNNNFEAVFEQSIMSTIQLLASDDCENVRLALSGNILPLNSILSESCFERNIVGLLMEILNKEESVRIQANFLLGLGKLPSNVDLTGSLEAIKHSIRAVIGRSRANWRTRRNILTAFVDVARFCDKDYFSDHFRIYYASLLGDSVFAVRRSASLILPLIAKRYGIRWAAEHLVPFFTLFTRDSRYLYRFVALYGIEEMIRPHLGSRTGGYLNDFQSLTSDNKKAATALAKIVKTTQLIQKELMSDKYRSILKLEDQLVDYCFSKDVDNNVAIYVEKDFESYKQTQDVYRVDDHDLDQWPYLQGILHLIYNKFLPIVDVLYRDPIDNVRNKAVGVLAVICRFIKQLLEEEEEDWIKECIKTLDQKEIDNIIEEINSEFKTAALKEEEKIDANLVEDEENEEEEKEDGKEEGKEAEKEKEKEKKVDVSKTILISSNDETQVDSLTEEVMDILEQKIADSSENAETTKEGAASDDLTTN